MSDRRVDAFFYGLFMDGDILISNGIEVVKPRQGYADGFELVIGNRATLVARSGARSYGMVMSVTHTDINSLYSADGLQDYCPEALSVNLIGNGTANSALPAICYNLLRRPAPEESNAEYAAKLRTALSKYEFPAEYIASVN